ncbi:non-ribosomal peptide synthetase [Paenarthrobacter aurescens]|uniref:non-ribosomal peptide synthetase n=1 Tax=Paenarthrobacter aurescens TaxID=43663 RepID=UPI0021C12225|nr:non-ribosomal peptide synthetase [Paenarthrobacter aurescens]MCT9868271.1 amino acid adenylation domain-containing protein [Paenarthrobacter aurescens]
MNSPIPASPDQPGIPEDQAPARMGLTAAQRGIWYAQKLAHGSPMYQIGQFIEIAGPLDVARLEAAVARAVAETPALNLAFGEDDDGPYQYAKTTVAAVQFTDLSECGDESVRERTARELMDADMAQARSVEDGGLLHTEVIRITGTRHFFYQRVHHLLLDGYSAVVVLRRVAAVYEVLGAAEDMGCAAGLDFAPLQELIADDHSYLSSDAAATDAAYWAGELEGNPVPAGLAGRPMGMADSLLRSARSLSPAAVEALESASGTAPALMLTAASLYLHRMTGEQHVSLALPVTARRGRLAKSTPSMLSNIVPIRVDITPGATVQEMVTTMGGKLRGALIHQRTRFESLSGQGGYAGPSVNILPVLENISFGEATGAMHILSTGPIDDLSIIVHGLGQGPRAEVTVQFAANADLYSQAGLDEHLTRFVRLLGSLLASPEDPTAALSVTTTAEEQALLATGDAESVDLPGHTVVEEFQLVATAAPERTAVVASDGCLTFAEVERRSNQLARFLRARGAGPGSTVAVRLDRSVLLPVAILAILKAGAAYVPLDPDYPAGRVQGMLEDAEPIILLTQAALAEDGDPGRPQTKVPVTALDSAGTTAALESQDHTPLPPSAGQHDLAYVIFTSGSTGRPKGVGVEHLALLNLLTSHRDRIFDPAERRLGRPLRVAHTAGLSFDASWDPILWLLAGHELHMVDNQTRRDPEALSLFLADELIDSIETTPSFAKALLAGGLFDRDAHPSVVALGGEAVDPATWRELAAHDGVVAYNFYGPTETTVDSLTAVMEPGTDVTLGGSVTNSRHYILDSGLNPVPANAIGELYVAGPNLARGYLDQPGLSAGKFVADPFVGDGSRMYRTGDVVRRLDDGTLQFLGRMDQQVKIRGFRIELAEIEEVLRGIPGVAQAAVTVTKNKAGYDQLLAYVTPAGTEPGLEDSRTFEGMTAPQPLDSSAIRKEARRTLPDYMVPAAVLTIDSLPLTANGKLDTRALPTHDPEATTTEPRTHAERVVSEAFREILGLEAVGREDDFFDLGGHSLLATRLAAFLRDATGSAPALRTIFEEPTVAGLAAALEHDGPSIPELMAKKRPAIIPLSFAQRRLWFLNRLDHESGAYNIPIVLTLKGHLEVDALEGALTDVVSRHETLRTIFPWSEGEPRQEILSPDAALTKLLAVQCDAGNLERALRAETQRGFDITSELPVRTVLFQLAPDHHVLAITLHHVAADGWSLAPLARDLSQAYTARLRGAVSTAFNLPIQYADYTLWQRESLGQEDDPSSPISRQLEFWARELKGSPEELQLPYDFPRGTREGDLPASSIPLELDAVTSSGLKALAKTHNASLFMVLQAALAALLTKSGAGEDIPLGTPVAGRTDTQLNELVGFFVNTLVLRTNTSGNPTAAELVESVRYTNLHAYGNQDAPFERVVEQLNPTRSRHRHPLFQVMLTLQNTPDAVLAMDGVEASADLGREPGGAKFDLLLDLAEQDGAERDGDIIAGTLAYNPSLFSRNTVERLAAGFALVAGQFATDSGVSLDQLRIQSPADHAAVLASSVATERDVQWTTILDAFSETATLRASQIAVAAGTGVAGSSWTFAQLEKRVHTIANGLMVHGVRPGDRVAVAIQRSADVVAAALAVLAAGAVYIPIDLSYPKQRIRMILEDSTPAVVIVDANATTGVEPDKAVTLAGLLARGAAAADGDQAERAPKADDLAYVLYTSGSTGRPKGVAVSHGALANLYAHHHRSLFAPRLATDADQSVAVAHIAGLGFDAAWDPMLWMVAGAELHMVPDEKRGDAESLTGYCLDHGIHVLETTPSFATQLLQYGLLEHQREQPLILILGGEAVSGALWERLATDPGVRALNFYGPTEFTVDSVMADIEGRRPVIGRPAGNTSAMVLDAYLQPVPAGVPGELYLAGAGMAQGYDQRFAETASRFVANPFRSDGSRMYRTGDVVRRDASGVLEFLARSDDQVKVRGFRIELGEVESALASHPQVRQVAAVPDGKPAQRIIAYVVGDVDVAELRTRAAELLPDYMVPAVFMSIPALPLTSHGKLDRAALPAPAAAGAGSGKAPASPEEHVIAGIFAEVLGLDSVAMDDDFFLMGGHSLLAITVMGKIREAFGASLPLRALFDLPTPAALLAAVASERPNASTHDDGTEVHANNSLQAGVTTLSEWIAARGTVRSGQPVLSFAQQRMWFLNQLDPGSADYNISMAAELEGEVDENALSTAIDALVVRHEILRTSYPAPAGTPHQEIHAAAQARGLLRVIPVHSEDEESRILAQEEGRGFDVTLDLPLRAVLLRRCYADDPGWVLQLVLHHIASDGASLAPLARDLSESYAAALEGTVSSRAPLTVQYADFSAWQQEELGKDGSPGQKIDDWREALSGIPTELSLPADQRRPREARQPAKQHTFQLSAETLESLNSVAARSNASLFMTLHGVLAGFLHRLGAGDDVVIGSPTAGRTDPALEELVGFFVNTLPLRISAAGNPSLQAMVNRARTSVLAAFDHDDVPFERLVEVLNPERELGRHPLFQTMLAVDNSPASVPELPGAVVRPLPGNGSGEAKFDLSFTFRPGTTGLSATLEYNAAMFQEETIERLVTTLVRFVERGASNPDTPIAELTLIDPEEAAALEALTAGRRSAVGHQTDAADGVLAAFAATVMSVPDSVALVTGRDEQTFAKLASSVAVLATGLEQQGVAAGDVVSVFLPRSAGTIQSLLGVIATGAVYNPIDTEYPDDRVVAILEDAAPSVVVTSEPVAVRMAALLTRVAARNPAREVPRLVMVTELLGHSHGDGLNSGQGLDSARELQERQPAGRDLSYVMFTSGSTGRPKGVEVSHGALGALLESHRATLFAGLDPAITGVQQNVAHTTGIGFDASWDPILWMISGHRLHLVDDAIRRDPAALAGYLEHHQISAWETTPGYARQLLKEPAFTRLLDGAGPAPESGFNLALGGEAFDATLWDELSGKENVTAWNLYGPTESAVDTLVARVRDHAAPVLGVPTSGTRLYILDALLRPALPGVLGELYIAGRQVANGYRGQPGLTAERFVADPFSSDGERMYRTGDLVVRHADGSIVFSGRNDQQVKIRGFRVEPGEIEQAAAGASNVKAAVVRAEPSGDSMRLVAWVVPEDGTVVDAPDEAIEFAEGVRSHLRSLLPDYMVPSAVVTIAEIPLTQHGKVDTAGLPDAASAPRTSGKVPRTPREQTVAAIFADVLSLDRAGVDESFFELGGHSFLAQPLIARINAALGTSLQVQSLFRSPTVEGLLWEASRGVEENAAETLRQILPLRTTGTKAPLFAVHPASGIAWGFASMLGSLDPERPLIGLQMPGMEPGATHPVTAVSLTELADAYIDSIRSVQPSGPYHLLGWSFGGHLVHRLATRLQELGEKVASLTILDAFPGTEENNDDVNGSGIWAAYLEAQGYALDDADTVGLDAVRAQEILRRNHNPLGTAPLDAVEAMVENFPVLARLIREQKPAVFDGELLLFRATADVPAGTPGAEAWEPFVTGRIVDVEVPDRHSRMLSDTALATIMPALAIQLGG